MFGGLGTRMESLSCWEGARIRDETSASLDLGGVPEALNPETVAV